MLMFTAEYPEGKASSLMLYRFAEGDTVIISTCLGTAVVAALAFSASTNTTHFSAQLHCSVTSQKGHVRNSY